MRIFLCLFLSVLLTGCFIGSNKTSDMGEITKISSLKQIEGVYSNLPVDAGYLLSQILFGKDSNRPTFIKVTALDESQLLVQGLTNDNYVTESKTFTKGKDFKFSNGEIEIESGVSVEGFEKQSLAVGVIHTNKSFVFNNNGDALLKTRSTGGLMLLMVVPMGATGTDYWQFKKVR